MRQIIKFGFGLVISSSAFSASPVDGFYLGLLGQLSRGPSNTQLNFVLDQSYTGNISYSTIGGGIGASLGYKIKNFRMEGEFLFNINNFGELKVGTCTLISPTVFGPEGVCPAFIEDNGLGFNGSTMGFYGFANVYYDFLPSNPNKNIFPYLGVGVGGALLQNTAQILSNNQYASEGNTPVLSYYYTNSNGGFAVQGIVGFSCFLDDFTTLGLDLRYATTINFNNSTTNNTITSSSYGIGTINLTAVMVLGDGQ